MASQSWSSNGKLMISGEYAVLWGADSLSMPIKFGQSLEVTELPGNAEFNFETEVLGKPWFEAEFHPETFDILETTNANTATYLQRIFKAVKQLNPSFLKNKKNYKALSRINFNNIWGLGSSSSLISNISWWANVDPFEVNRMISLGSGYDIACARSNSPIMYSFKDGIPLIENVTFNPLFSENIYFVYLGQKYSTELAIRKFLENAQPPAKTIYEISDLGHAFLNAKKTEEFMQLMQVHEEIIASLISATPIQVQKFSDFKGRIKSLGAWGGDFCMAVSTEGIGYVESYFEQKGLINVLRWNDIVLT